MSYVHLRLLTRSNCTIQLSPTLNYPGKNYFYLSTCPRQTFELSRLGCIHRGGKRINTVYSVKLIIAHVLYRIKTKSLTNKNTFIIKTNNKTMEYKLQTDNCGAVAVLRVDAFFCVIVLVIYNFLYC